MYKKLTQVQTMHLMGLSVLSNIADIFEKKSENRGLQLEGIFLKISKRFQVKSFDYVTYNFIAL